MKLTSFSEAEPLPSAPLRTGEDLRTWGWDKLLALLPAVVWSTVANGARTVTVMLLSVLFAAVWEAAAEWLLRRRFTLGDLTAVTEGALFGVLMPVTVPLYLIPLGTLFGMLVGKSLPGGLGRQLASPSVLGAAALSLVFPAQMNSYLNFGTRPSAFAVTVAGETGSILERLRASPLSSGASVEKLLLGTLPSAIGSLSVLFLLCGWLYLVFRRLAKPEILFFSLLPLAVYAMVKPDASLASDSMILRAMLYEIMAGELLLVTAFHASEPQSCPDEVRTRALYGIFIGAVTLLIRSFTSLGEGAVYAVLLAQLLSSGIRLLRYRRA